MAGDPDHLVVADAAAWRVWLATHHSDLPDVWLVLAKKATTEPTSLTYDQALEEALCQGWIDGQVRKRDDRTYLQRFTPRRPGSMWSQRNVGLVGQLVAQGRLQPAGAEEVARAKGGGRWEAAYPGPATMEVPADLEQALAQVPAAHAVFDILSSQNRYAILHRITTAKRADTRTRRIEQYVAMLARGETPYAQRRDLGDR